jgi:hypothetical protein
VREGESYFAPAGGANWVAAQEGGGSDLFSCFCFFFCGFFLLFLLVGFCDFYLVSAFSEFIGI